jgi:chromosomal replication initiator protein
VHVDVADRVGEIRKRVHDKIGATRFRTWFDATEFRLTPTGVELVVANAFIASWIASNYMEEILAAARDVLRNLPDPHVGIVTQTAATAPAARSAATPPRKDHPRTSVLRHGMDSFVVGDANRVAHAAVTSVIHSPGQAFKLLVLHGACGLGKTHLLQGLCNGLRTGHPSLEWRYVSGEEFTNDFIFAVKSGRVDAFRARFRKLDVLVVDDIHFLANKKATQEEFLHTFNAIDAAGKCVVLSSDCHPRSIATLSERLTNRLIAGMVAQIDAPELETRRLILVRRAAVLGVSVPPDVIEFIASRVARNIRELEGALFTLTALAALSKLPISMDLARRALQESAIRTRRVPELTDIARTVAEYFEVPVEHLHSKSRDLTVTAARSMTFFLARRHTAMSFPEIGRALGKRNHSTVLMATQRVERQVGAEFVMQWKAASGTRQAPIRTVVEGIEARLAASIEPAQAG